MTPARKIPDPTTPDRNDNIGDLPADGDDLLAQRCLQYLLGELSVTESAKLESELRDVPAVNRELLLQSELLCALAASTQSPLTPSSPLIPSSLAPSPSPGFPAAARRWVMVVVTLAACLAVAVVGYRWRQDDDRDASRLAASHRGSPSRDAPNRDVHNDEALLIARAWAASHVSEPDDEQWGISEGDVDFVDEQPTNDDSSLGWMVIAVAADANLPLSDPGTPHQHGAQTDG